MVLCLAAKGCFLVHVSRSIFQTAVVVAATAAAAVADAAAAAAAAADFSTTTTTAVFNCPLLGSVY